MCGGGGYTCCALAFCAMKPSGAPGETAWRILYPGLRVDRHGLVEAHHDAWLFPDLEVQLKPLMRDVLD